MKEDLYYHIDYPDRIVRIVSSGAKLRVEYVSMEDGSLWAKGLQGTMRWEYFTNYYLPKVTIPDWEV